MASVGAGVAVDGDDVGVLVEGDVVVPGLDVALGAPVVGESVIVGEPVTGEAEGESVPGMLGAQLFLPVPPQVGTGVVGTLVGDLVGLNVGGVGGGIGLLVIGKVGLFVTFGVGEADGFLLGGSLGLLVPLDVGEVEGFLVLLRVGEFVTTVEQEAGRFLQTPQLSSVSGEELNSLEVAHHCFPVVSIVPTSGGDSVEKGMHVVQIVPLGSV